ncbi:MAG: DNA-protecting protein DprA [Rhizobiales bacterium]|nr:DNA-protecting protein DprA [Hyphomicrobiales bacterium]
MTSVSLTHDERRDRLRLIRSENIGPTTYQRLIEHYGSAADALIALPELSQRGGLKRQIRLYSPADADRDIERAAAMGARFVELSEDDYPALMRHIDAPPPLVCIIGQPGILSRPTLAIVGARNASANGRKFARQMAAELGNQGITIVSGLARGIDTAAHQASLETGTAAVLAGGLDVIYPPENAELHHAIAERGLLVSEMAPGTRPKAEFFPRRNRLISGMSRGVLVVEAALRSGSLITARLAGEQGRDVLAVPGSPLDPRAAGTNKLIRDGAVLVSGVSDILDAIAEHPAQFDLGPAPAAAKQAPAGDTVVGDADRRAVLSLLGPSPVEIDDLIRESGCTSQSVANVLLELEIAGKLTRHAGQRVSMNIA